MDIQNILTGLALEGATWVMWLLVGLSVLGLTVALERGLTVLATRDDTHVLRRDLVQLLREGDLTAAAHRLERSRSYEAKVVRAGVEAAADGAHAAEERMAGAAQTQRLHMEERLIFLGTLGANAPFVGLLGTVIGIIGAFHQLDASAGKVTAGLMAEVGEALVATAVGILVALPTVAFYNLFQRINKTRLARADALGRELLAHLRAERR
jgi:biopolymer transport protein ExbB